MSRLGTYTKEAAKEAKDSENEGSAWIKLENGDNVIRMLPPIDGNPEPWVTVWQHFYKREDGSYVVFNCPRKMADKACPVCAMANKAPEESKKDFLPNLRNIGFAVNRKEETPAIKLVAFGFGIKERFRFFREKQGDFTDAKTGREVLISKTGQGLKTKYMVDLGEPFDLTKWPGFEQAVEELPDLRKFTEILPYETIVAKLTDAEGAAATPIAVPARQVKQLPSAASTERPSAHVRRAATWEDDTPDPDPTNHSAPVIDDDLPF